MRRPISGLRPALGLVAALLAGCSGAPAPPLVVGASSDPASLVLAQVYAGALRSSGAAARVQIVADPLAALDTGAVAVVPGFTGQVLQSFQPGATALSDKAVYRAMVGALPEGVAAGDYTTAAEDKPALVVTKSTATSWGGGQLGALTAHCAGLVIGSVRGVVAPATVGSCNLPAATEFGDDTALFAALRAGQLVAAWTTTAAPDIPKDLVVLADSKRALVRAENVVPLYRSNELTERQLLSINEVAGVLDTAALADMRQQVAGRADPQAVADAWLAEHPLGR